MTNRQRMDRNDPFNHFDICTRVFNIVKTVSTRVLGPICLVWEVLVRKVSSAYALRWDGLPSQVVNPMARGRRESKAGSCGAPVTSLSNVPSREGEDNPDDGKKAVPVGTSMERRARAPKKSVSINENAEEIVYGKRKVKRKKSITEDVASDEYDEKPLKSILKVGSTDLNRR